MGNSPSYAMNNDGLNTGSKKTEDICFTRGHINYYFDIYTKKHNPRWPEIKVDDNLFSIISNKLLMININTDLEKIKSMISENNLSQINPFISQINYFSDRFEYILSNLQKSVYLEPKEFADNWQDSMITLGTSKAALSEVPFVLKLYFGVCSDMVSYSPMIPTNIMDTKLQKLHQIIKQKYNSSGMSLLNFPDFTNNLTSIASQLTAGCEHELSIKTSLISILIRISKINNDIATLISALKIALSVDPNEMYCGDMIDLDFLSDYSINVPFVNSLKLPSDMKVACMSSNSGYIFFSSDCLKVLNLRTNELTSESEILTDYRVIAADDNYLLVLTPDVENYLNIYCYRLGNYESLFLDTKIKFKTQIKTLSASFLNGKAYISSKEHDQVELVVIKIGESLEVTNQYEISINTIDSQMIVYNNHIHFVSLQHSPNQMVRVILDENVSFGLVPTPFFSKTDSLITSYGSSIYLFEKDEGGPQLKFISENSSKFLVPLRDNIRYEDTQNPTFKDFICYLTVKLSNQLSLLMPKIFDYKADTKLDSCVQQALQFFVSQKLESTLSISIDLCRSCIANKEMQQSIRDNIMIFLLQIIASNLRFYTYRFPFDNFSVDDASRCLFRSIRDIICLILKSELATPLLASGCFLIIKSGFKYLYFPNYSELFHLVNGSIPDESLGVALPYLRESTAIFYSTSAKTLSILKKYQTKSVVYSFLGDVISLINNELYFINENNLLIEAYIAEYVKCSFHFYQEQIDILTITSYDQYPVDCILRLISRILLIPNASLISAELAYASLSLINLLDSNSIRSINARPGELHDLFFANPQKGAKTVRNEVCYFETDHPYTTSMEQSYDFSGASEISIEFDERCVTEYTTDFLQIFDKPGGVSVCRTMTGPAGSNWAGIITIKGDTCHFSFHADRTTSSTNEWGIKCKISANVPVLDSPVTPDAYLSIYNLLCFALGHCVNMMSSQEPHKTPENVTGDSYADPLIQALLHRGVNRDVDNYYDYILQKITGTLKNEELKQDRELLVSHIMAAAVHASNTSSLFSSSISNGKIPPLTQSLIPLRRVFSRIASLKQSGRDDEISEYKYNIIEKCKFFLQTPVYIKSLETVIDYVTSHKLCVGDIMDLHQAELKRVYARQNVDRIIETFFDMKKHVKFSTGIITFFSRITNKWPSKHVNILYNFVSLPNTLSSLRLVVLKTLILNQSFKTDVTNIAKIIKCSSLHVDSTDIDEYILNESLWHLLLNLVISNSDQKCSDLLCETLKTTNNELHLSKLTTLLYSLKLVSNVHIDKDLVSGLITNDCSPRLFVSALKLIIAFAINNDTKGYPLLPFTDTGDFMDFLKGSLAFIGMSVISDTYSAYNFNCQQQVYISNHLISLLRTLLRSELRDSFIDLLEAIIQKENTFDSYAFIGSSVVLGGATKVGYESYVKSGDSSTHVLNEFNPLSSTAFSYDNSSLKFHSVNINSVIPISYVEPESELELKPATVSSLAAIAIKYIKEKMHSVDIYDSCTSFNTKIAISTALSVFTLLPIVLQHPANVNNFLSSLGTSINAFLQFGSKITGEKVLTPFVYTFSNSIYRYLSEDFLDKNFERSKEVSSEDKHRSQRFSQSSNDSIRPHIANTFVVLYGRGEITKNVISSYGSAAFVSRKSLSCSGIFEVTVLEASSRVKIGLVDSSTMSQSMSVVLPIEQEQRLSKGDVISVLIHKNKVRYFINGKKTASDVFHDQTMEDVLPFIVCKGPSSLEFNFGDSPFSYPSVEGYSSKTSSDKKSSMKAKTSNYSIRNTPAFSDMLHFSVGSPCYVKCINIEPSVAKPDDTLVIESDLRRFLYKIGIVEGFIDDDKVVVSFADMHTKTKQQCVIQTTFLEPIERVDSNSTEYMSAYKHENAYREIHSCLLMLAIRCTRYSILSILDVDYLAFEKVYKADIFSLLLMELIQFQPIVVSSFTQKPYGLMKYIEKEIMVRKIHRVIMKTLESRDEVSFFDIILSNAVNTLNKPGVDSNEGLYSITPSSLRFSSSSGIKSLYADYKVVIPNCAGYIPVIVDGDKSILNCMKINNEPLLSSCSSTGFFDSEEVHIKCDYNSKDPFSLQFLLYPMMSYKPDTMLHTAPGAIHIIILMLSLLFYSSEKYDSNLLKILSNILPLSFTLMSNGGVLSNLFAFEIIASVITNMEWGVPFDTQTVKLINKQLGRFNMYETKMLTISKQHLILLKVMLDFNSLEVAKRKALEEMRCGGESIEHGKEFLFLLKKYWSDLNELNKIPVFDALALSIMTITAVSHNWKFSLPFPSFLIAEECFMTSKTITYNKSHFVQISQNELALSHPTDNEWAYVFTYKPELFEINGKTFKITSNRNLIRTNGLIQMKVKFNKAPHDFSIIIETFDYKESDVELRDFMELLPLFEKAETAWSQEDDETLLYALKQTKIDESMAYSKLVSKHEPKEIERRRKLLGYVDASMSFLMQYIDLGQNNLFSSAVICAKGAIDTKHKVKFFNASIFSSIKGTSRQHLKFSRTHAANFLNRPSHPSSVSLLKQLMLQVPLNLIGTLKRDTVPWNVELLGEGATDAGGPGREILTEMSLEIMSPASKLFFVPANSKAGRLIPDPRCSNDLMLEYAGVVISIAYISKILQPFKFDNLVWSFFTGKDVTVQDIYEMDDSFKKIIDSVQNNQCSDLYFTIPSITGEIHKLVPNGDTKLVEPNDRNYFIKKAIEFRIEELRKPLLALRRGVEHFMPREALHVLSPWELEYFVRGESEITVDDIKRCCKYEEVDNNNQMLWKVLESLSNEERMLFIKFTSGRMTLPSFSSFINIQWVPSSEDLPVAATCSSTIKIPRYKDEATLKKKLLTAVLYGGDIVMDRHMNTNRISQLL